MLHTKFRGNRCNDSGVEDCFKGFNIYIGMAAILVI